MVLKGFKKFLINLACFLFPFKVYGTENIPEGGAVFVSNHLSLLDCVFLRKIYKGEMYFLAKKEIFNSKFWAKVFTSYGAIPIDREKPDLKSLLAAVNVLKKESKLVIFAEGTRNKTGTTELQPLKSGSAVLAAKSKKPIVPVMVHKRARLFVKTPLIIGEPFELSEFYGVKFGVQEIAEMDEIVREKMIEQQIKLRGMLIKPKKRKKTK